MARTAYHFYIVPKKIREGVKQRREAKGPPITAPRSMPTLWDLWATKLRAMRAREVKKERI